MESLYTKYRPQTFADVVGQTHVVTTLERAVIEGRTSHAYLFCGPRGTGKTTMARLLAKALMCERGEGHLPDGTCDQCQLIAAGEHPDVYELDAASRTGVDNVREEIISRVSFAPVRARCKMYIIDEVHMLTTAAFNALLKTLEEPPDHVVFVLCTTDPQKIPETILSRVQRFDFHAIGNADIQARLTYICDREGFTYDEEALALVVRHARGGMRDAISELEQLSVSGGGSISVDVARDVLGEVSASTLERMSLAMAKRDVPSLFAQVESLVDAGRDLLQFSRALAGRLRDVYVVTAIGPSSDVVQATDDDLPALSREAKAFGSVDRVARALALLSDASNEMRVAPNQRLVLEVALTKIARPQTELTLEALADRVATLERQIAALSSPTARRVEEPREAEVRSREEKTAGVRDTSAQAPAAAKERVAARPEAAAQRTAAAKPAAAQAAAPSAPAPQQPPAVQTTPVRPEPPQRPAQTQPAVTPQPQPASQSAAQEAPAPVASSAAPVQDAGTLQRMWRQAVDDLRAAYPQHGTLLMNSTAVSDDGATVTVSLPKGSTFAVKMLGRNDVRAHVEPIVRQVFGPRALHVVEGGRATGVSIEPAATTAPASQPASPRPVAARPTPTPRPAPASAPASVSDQQSMPKPPVAQQTAPAFAPMAQSAPAAQPTSAPTPATAPASAPQTVPQPAPAQQPTYPAPWDPLPVAGDDYDRVPYDDADLAPYEEDLNFAGEFGGIEMAPAPASASRFAPAQQPAFVSAPASYVRPTRTPAPAPTAAAAPTVSAPVPSISSFVPNNPRFIGPNVAPAPAPEPASRPQPASAPAPKVVPAPAPKPRPARQSATAPAPAPQTAPASTPQPASAPVDQSAPKPKRSSRREASDVYPPDLIAMLTDVFGEGTTYTIEPPANDVSDGDEGISVAGEGYDDADLPTASSDDAMDDTEEFVAEPIDDADFEDEYED